MDSKSCDFDKILKELSIYDKARLLVGNGWWNTHELKEHSVQSTFLSDGPHGLRTQKERADHLGLNKSLPSTCYPSECLTANSFDKDLLYRVGSSIAREAASFDVDLVLGPGVNIKRSPLCGRNFEYFSEDPILSGELAAAFINGVQDEGVGACIKHYALNSTENKRFLSDSIVDEQTMREIYLKAFEIAIKKSNPMAIMTAYNKINGEYASQNTHLLKDILIEEWGYDGLVVSDWGAVSDKAKSVKAGLDLEMPDSHGLGLNNVLLALKDGSLTEEELDRAVLSVLKFAKRVLNNKGKNRKTTSIEEADKVALDAALNSMVLLKNQNNALPIGKNERILVLGDAAKNPHFQGGGSSHINANKVTSLLDGLKSLNASFKYVEGFNYNDEKTPLDLIEAVKKEILDFDSVIFVVGLANNAESEGYDRTSLALPKSVNEMIQKLAPLAKKSAVLLCTGAPVELPWVNKVSSILYCGLSGQAGGLASAMLLKGEVNPSGRLAETWCKRLQDTPTYHCPPIGTRVHYNEGQFVGYRWYQAREIKPQFCFGAGLSYTQFEYSDIDLKTEKDTYKLKVTIMNKGEQKGATTLMLFLGVLCSPSKRPLREMRDFKKVWLEAKQKKTIEFEFDKELFACFNEHGKKVVHSGEYIIELGTSVEEIIFSKKIALIGDKVEYSIDSSLAELFMHSLSAGILAKIFQKKNEDAGKKDQLSEMVSKMAADLPLRALATFMPKEFTGEVIDNILKAVGAKQ